MRMKQPKKSNGKKSAKGGVNIRQASSSISTPSSQVRRGMQSLSIAPVATSRQQRVMQPVISRTKRGERIVHRELISSISGVTGSTPTVSKFAVNPGLAGTFPWLSDIAKKWDQYRFHRLQFEYVTRSSTSSVGSVILAPDYDASDPTPTTEAQITAYEDAVEDAVWRDITCVLRPDSMFPIGPRKFVRSTAVAGDVKTFDVANFFVAVLEQADTNQIGKLWVNYDCEFFVPQNSPSDGTQPNGSSLYAHHAAQTYATGVAEPNEYEVKVFDGLNIGTPATGVFTPPAGVYRIWANQTFSDSAAEANSIILEIMKNGAALSQPLKSQVALNLALGAANRQEVSVHGILAMNGTDTFQIQGTITGAAGTLLGAADLGQLLITLA